MQNKLRIFSFLFTAACLAPASSLTQAQALNGVIVGPVVVPPPAAVPLFNTGLLIVLALMLLGLAVWVLRRGPQAAKWCGLVVLGAGLALSGAGVERAMAIIPLLMVEGAACDGDAEISYDAIGEGFAYGLQNTCPKEVEIKEFVNRQCPPEAPLVTEIASCKVGTVLAPSGEDGDYCETLPYCLE